MSDIKSMTVSTVISSISSGEMKVNDLATLYGKTDRTIQKYIKSLGYVWNPKERQYSPTGDSYSNDNDSKLFTDIVESYSVVDNKKPTKTVNSTVDNKKSTNNSNGRVNSTVENEKPINNSNARLNNTVDSTKVKNTVDSIDRILFGKSIESQRVQRAYYIDRDIASIIDTVDNKQKSNLVNECLRRVFEEKGLL